MSLVEKLNYVLEANTKGTKQFSNLKVQACSILSAAKVATTKSLKVAKSFSSLGRGI